MIQYGHLGLIFSLVRGISFYIFRPPLATTMSDLDIGSHKLIPSCWLKGRLDSLCSGKVAKILLIGLLDPRP